MQGAYVKRINASPSLHIRSSSNRLKKPIKLKEYDYSIDLQGNYLNFGQPSCFHHVSKEHPKNSIWQNIDVGRDSSRSVTRDINHRSISPLSKERERGSAMKLRKTVKSSQNVGRLKLNSNFVTMKVNNNVKNNLVPNNYRSE